MSILVDSLRESFLFPYMQTADLRNWKRKVAELKTVDVRNWVFLDSATLRN